MGWFGPRGLASIVFALLAIEQLGESALVEQAVAAVSLTVVLSVLLPGVLLVLSNPQRMAPLIPYLSSATAVLNRSAV